MQGVALDGTGPEAAWEAGWPGWLYTLADIGPFVLVSCVVVLLLRAFLRRGLYQTHDVLSEPAREELRAAIASAEGKTTGEIVPVVLGRSDSHPDARWRAAVFCALIGSLLLVGYLPWRQPGVLILVQMVLGLFGYLAARFLPDFCRLFVRPERACEMAEEQAIQEFFQLGVMATEERTGVLLFVSLFEHRVVVLADEGICAKVETQTWVDTDEAVLAGIRKGSLLAGLVAGIEEIGAVLHEHFPAPEHAAASGAGEGPEESEESRDNELSDHLVVRDY